MLHRLNNTIPSIKFTYDLHDGSIPYLDVKLIRMPVGSINTDRYNKEVAANILLNSHSNHPMKMKYNVAFNLFYRVLSLSSSCYHNNNIVKLTDILRTNSYPNSVILKQKLRALSYINNTNTTTQSIQFSQNNDQNRPKYRSVIYIHNLSERVSKLIITTTKDFIVAPKPYRQLKSTLHTNMKQNKSEKEEAINVVCKIPCSQYKQCYIGQTENCFKSRKRTHAWDIQPGNNRGQTALAMHVREKEHRPDFDSASILAIESIGARDLQLRVCTFKPMTHST